MPTKLEQLKALREMQRGGVRAIKPDKKATMAALRKVAALPPKPKRKPKRRK